MNVILSKQISGSHYCFKDLKGLVLVSTGFGRIGWGGGGGERRRWEEDFDLSQRWGPRNTCDVSTLITASRAAVGLRMELRPSPSSDFSIARSQAACRT